MIKLKVLLISFIILLMAFISALFVTINGISVSKFWFSLALFLIGIYALIYYFLFKLDSSLYYSMLLIMVALASAYKFFNNVEFKQYYPMYVLCFALASLSVFVRFRQYIHFKLFAILGIEAILLISYKNKVLPLEVVLLINAIYLINIAVNLFFRVRKNLRRE